MTETEQQRQAGVPLRGEVKAQKAKPVAEQKQVVVPVEAHPDMRPGDEHLPPEKRRYKSLAQPGHAGFYW